VLDLDFDGGNKGDANVDRSLNNNNNDDDQDGGSSIKYVTLADGRKVVQFNIDRYSDRPAEEGKNYRSELTSFAPEDRLKPGHTYSTKWNMQLTEWERDRSPWGEMFLQVRQSKNTGVPDTALGVKDDKYSIFIHGKWTDLGLPPVSETIGDWQEWDLKIKMPEADGSGGQLEVWRNGKKVYDIPNYKLDSGYADGNPYLKFGIYKARWKIDNVATDSVKRQANFDDFRLTDLGR